MSQTFTGVVQFANGAPAANVTVRLFDADVLTEDDDLTVEPGLTNEKGVFTVTYDPERDLDFADIFRPYLHFSYKHHGENRTHQADVQPDQRDYRLPEIPPLKFVPATHGFQFVNRYPGYWIPFSVPSIPDIPSVSAIYGLCGGMCATSLDFLLAGRPIPQRRRRPGRVTPLHRYIHKRQVDSLTGGSQVVRFARWMALSDQAVHLRTAEELKTIRANLDKGIPTPIGMVYVSTKDTMQIWHNHQILACAYEELEDGRIRILVYDPNYPRRNDVFVESWPDKEMGGVASVQRIGKQDKVTRGYFVMPYEPVIPPTILDDDAASDDKDERGFG
ncbi:MAG: hypothetical protein H6654_03140 [Ardenticatenaceae bacterium]|nr:hypothetical protein [Anaerolineales bacterium]MCB8941188.1 hypothetical protein [Ardenticatenaceae bacterium]MCB8972526.1 hypothetical protein [Ardenticatenaceae bacterium]